MEKKIPDNEFYRYWSLLTTSQKDSVIGVILSLTRAKESGYELRETEVEYQSRHYKIGEEILKQLSEPEKKSVLLMIKAFLPIDENTSEAINIAQYNKEIDDAMKRMDAGVFITHEDLEKKSEQW